MIAQPGCQPTFAIVVVIIGLSGCLACLLPLPLPPRLLALGLGRSRLLLIAAVRIVIVVAGIARGTRASPCARARLLLALLAALLALLRALPALFEQLRRATCLRQRLLQLCAVGTLGGPL
jgi:hypothetical protein